MWLTKPINNCAKNLIFMATTKRFEPPFLNKEFVIKASRSGGKGGQNVNKVSTRIQLQFDVLHSLLLSDDEKTRILQKLVDKLIDESMLQVSAQAGRSQLENKETAIKKIYALLNKCFVEQKKRKATKPTKASNEKRLTTKKRDAEIKRLRKIEE